LRNSLTINTPLAEAANRQASRAEPTKSETAALDHSGAACYDRWFSMPQFSCLSDLTDLESAIAESRERLVLLFKHSRHCGVSCEALDELHAHIDRSPGHTTYRLITVQTHRPVSDAVAKRFGVRHETPQALLLRHGKVVWNASHFRITAAELDRAVSAD
jgi:thioredoxin 1